MGFIYVGRGKNDRGSKIGNTGRPEQERLRQHRTANPSFQFSFLFESPFYKQLEKELSHYFESKRIRKTKEWFVLDDGDLASLEALTRNFEAIIRLRSQVELLKNLESSPDLLVGDSCVDAACLRLRSLREERYHLDQAIERDESWLKLRIGPNDGIDGYATWKSQVRPLFDRELFEQDHPGVYDGYCRPAICRSFKLL
jgi:hypothetical protein